MLVDSLALWIKPALTSWEEIIDIILLEQFLVDLEENTQRWVCCYYLKTSRKALRLAENFDCA